MLSIALYVSLTAPQCAEPEAWLAGERQTKDERRETRRRLEATWKALGADREAVAVLSAIALRESTYDACAWHQLGPNENGYGALGLFWKFHKGKVAPSLVEQYGTSVLYIPEVSAIASWRIFVNARDRYHVKDWANAGEVFAGRIHPKRRDESRQNRFCARLERRGVNCREPVSELGDALPRGASEQDVPFVLKLIEAAG